MWATSFLRLTLLCTLVGLVPACSCESPTHVPGSTVPEQCSDQPLVLTPQKTDILFVIDNSGSMADEQAAVARELPAFISQLQAGGGLNQDFQLGVITTSVYARPLGTNIVFTYPDQSGKLRAVPLVAQDGGTVPGTERFLTHSDPDLLSKFDRLVRQGIDGSGQETPFEAIRLATSPTELGGVPLADGGNQEFFRDGARLLIVVVSDEDDCSESVRPPTVGESSDPAVDNCRTQSALLRPVGDYYSDFTHLLDSTGARREVLFAMVGAVSPLNKEPNEIVVNLPDGGRETENVDCPNASGAGYRQADMARLFDSSLNDLASVCLASYHDFLIATAKLATTGQTLQLQQNVPDPGVLVVEVTRANGTVQKCTTSNPNGLISYEPPAGGRLGRIHFEGSCLHRDDDKLIQVKMLCVG